MLQSNHTKTHCNLYKKYISLIGKLEGITEERSPLAGRCLYRIRNANSSSNLVGCTADVYEENIDLGTRQATSRLPHLIICRCVLHLTHAAALCAAHVCCYTSPLRKWGEMETMTQQPKNLKESGRKWKTCLFLAHLCTCQHSKGSQNYREEQHFLQVKSKIQY